MCGSNLYVIECSFSRHPWPYCEIDSFIGKGTCRAAVILSPRTLVLLNSARSSAYAPNYRKALQLVRRVL